MPPGRRDHVLSWRRSGIEAALRYTRFQKISVVTTARKAGVSARGILMEQSLMPILELIAARSILGILALADALLLAFAVVPGA